MSLLKVTKFMNGPLILSTLSETGPDIDVYVKTKTKGNEIPGTAHFLEHIILSGKNQQGYTTREYTAYNFKNVTMSSVLENLMTPDFGKKTFDYERKRILEEENTELDKNVDKAHYKALKCDDILGNPRAITKNSVVEFHKKHYVPSNFIFHVCSAKFHDEILSHLKRHFDLKKTTKNIKPTFVPNINLLIKKSQDFFDERLHKLSSKFIFVKTLGHNDLRFVNFLGFLKEFKDTLLRNAIEVFYFPYTNKGLICFKKF